jgi:mono/diheme cytochrome c family protein
MLRRTGLITGMLALLSLTATQAALAETPTEILSSLEATAKQADRGYRGFSAQRGEQFFKATHGAEWSCASCHGNDATATGKHAKTGKLIQPLAPAANARRFTDPAKVEKWFRRNCNDVLGRACTAQEKGDVLAWLLTLKK